MELSIASAGNEYYFRLLKWLFFSILERFWCWFLYYILIVKVEYQLKNIAEYYSFPPFWKLIQTSEKKLPVGTPSSFLFVLKLHKRAQIVSMIRRISLFSYCWVTTTTRGNNKLKEKVKKFTSIPIYVKTQMKIYSFSDKLKFIVLLRYNLIHFHWN